jgi:hypothetical protein
VEGLKIGTQVFNDTKMVVTLPQALRSRHVYVTGQTSSGKTTLFRNCIVQDFHAGHGLAVLAPEREMIRDELLPFVPESRLDDVVYIDPVDTSSPIPLNPLHVEPGEDLHVKADETITALTQSFNDEGTGAGSRWQTILAQAVFSLMEVPGSTLLDVEKLLDRSDSGFREWIVNQLKDDDARRFWTNTYPTLPRDAHLPIVNRLTRLLKPRVIRSMLCTPGQCFSIRKAMDEGKILLFDLSDGVLGAGNARMLGRLIVSKLELATMSRANVPKNKRRFFACYLDEFQSFVGVAASSYETLLQRARKYNVALHLSHQQTSQLPGDLLHEILGNVATVISFRSGAHDARRLSKEMVNTSSAEMKSIPPEVLQSLEVGQAWTRIDRTVFQLAAYKAPEYGDPAASMKAKRRSREQFAVRKSEWSSEPGQNEREPVDGFMDIDPNDVL